LPFYAGRILFCPVNLVIKIIGRLLIIAAQNGPYQTRVFEQVPVSKRIKFPARCDNMGPGDGFKTFIFIFTV
jgi:hypothetical protein